MNLLRHRLLASGNRHRLLACGAGLTLTLAVAACGPVATTQHPYDATAENNGVYVQLGQVNYQLQISRVLNPYSAEDHEYLVGLPPGEKGPNPGQIWYGVFLYAVNPHGQPAMSTDDFRVVDTQGNVYHPVALDPSINQFAWTAQTIMPHSTEPAPNTTAFFGSTQGGLLLFKLDNSVYGNRPLTLEVRAPGVSHVATISLDL